MAIDSKEKRAAVFGVARPWWRDKFPVATPDEEWRISSGNAYGGNALSGATGPAAGVSRDNIAPVRKQQRLAWRRRILRC
jgi:hypothetical protein